MCEDDRYFTAIEPLHLPIPEKLRDEIRTMVSDSRICIGTRLFRRFGPTIQNCDGEVPEIVEAIVMKR